jgi:ADP-ribosylation factor GTPase-activating protein 2/3
MKVGGNESATKFFQSNGGTAALNSKDPKTKYTSNAATKYKEELKKRATKDELEYVIRFAAQDAVLIEGIQISKRSCDY